MTMLNTTQSWNVGRVGARCAGCGADLPPNTECWAALCDGGVRARPEPDVPPEKAKAKKDAGAEPSPFVRVDFCLACWGAGTRPEELSAEAREEIAPGSPGLEMFSFWKTTVPLPQQKKKLLVDDAVLMDVFQRMEGKSQPQEIRFRFVLALILMRKRLLKYEGMEEAKDERRKTKDERCSQDSTVRAPDSVAAASAPEIWRMLSRGAQQPVHVVNPHLTADQITDVSQQLSAILAEEG